MSFLEQVRRLPGSPPGGVSCVSPQMSGAVCPRAACSRVKAVSRARGARRSPGFPEPGGHARVEVRPAPPCGRRGAEWPRTSITRRGPRERSDRRCWHLSMCHRGRPVTTPATLLSGQLTPSKPIRAHKPPYKSGRTTRGEPARPGEFRDWAGLPSTTRLAPGSYCNPRQEGVNPQVDDSGIRPPS